MTDIVFQENKIKELKATLYSHLSKIYSRYAALDFSEPGEEQSIYQDIEFTTYKFNQKIQELYFLVLNYLENKNSTELIAVFKRSLNHIFEEKYNGIITIEDEDDHTTHYVSKELDQINRILLSFQAFDEKLNENIGILYLQNILKHTAVIIAELNKTPEKESEVYNSVKHVISSTFPDFIGLTESFYKEAKHYKPDILIPSLKTAVEYKYAKDINRLTKTVEEILIDVQGYANHPLYKLFFAVFYIYPGVCTEERFQILWNGYNFPNNWKPILVIGK